MAATIMTIISSIATVIRRVTIAGLITATILLAVYAAAWATIYVPSQHLSLGWMFLWIVFLGITTFLTIMSAAAVPKVEAW